MKKNTPRPERNDLLAGALALAASGLRVLPNEPRHLVGLKRLWSKCGTRHSFYDPGDPANVLRMVLEDAEGEVKLAVLGSLTVDGMVLNDPASPLTEAGRRAESLSTGSTTLPAKGCFRAEVPVNPAEDKGMSPRTGQTRVGIVSRITEKCASAHSNARSAHGTRS